MPYRFKVTVIQNVPNLPYPPPVKVGDTGIAIAQHPQVPTEAEIGKAFGIGPVAQPSSLYFKWECLGQM